MKMINQLRRLFHRKPAALAVQTISEPELDALFLNAPNNPLWRATLADLDQQVQEQLDDTIDERLTNDQMRFRLGEVSGLLKLKRRLQDREAHARLTQSQTGTEPPEES